MIVARVVYGLSPRTRRGAPHSRAARNGELLQDQGESGRRFRTGRLSGLMAVGALLLGLLVPVGTEAAIEPSE